MGCSITGTPINNGDEILMFAVNHWQPTHGIYNLMSQMSLIVRTVKGKNEALLRGLTVQADFHKRNIFNPFSIFRYGIYDSYGSVEGFQHEVEIDDVVYIHKPVVDFILQDRKGLEPDGVDGLDERVRVVYHLTYFCFLARKELFSGLVGQQHYNLEEILNQAKILKLTSDLLKDKARELDWSEGQDTKDKTKALMDILCNI